MIRRWEQVGTTFAMIEHEQCRPLLGWNALHLVSKRKKVLRSTKSVRIAMYQAPSLKFKSSRLRQNTAGIVLRFGTGRADITKMPSPREFEIGTGDVSISNKFVDHTLVQSQSLKIQRVEMR